MEFENDGWNKYGKCGLFEFNNRKRYALHVWVRAQPILTFAGVDVYMYVCIITQLFLLFCLFYDAAE